MAKPGVYLSAGRSDLLRVGKLFERNAQATRGTSSFHVPRVNVVAFMSPNARNTYYTPKIAGRGPASSHSKKGRRPRRLELASIGTRHYYSRSLRCTSTSPSEDKLGPALPFSRQVHLRLFPSFPIPSSTDNTAGDPTTGARSHFSESNVREKNRRQKTTP